MARQVRSGQLRFDPPSAQRLIGALKTASSQLRGLVAEAGGLAEPLRLGDNLMGRAMSGHLVRTAVGTNSGALSLLGDFAGMLDDLLSAMQAAADQYVSTEEETAGDMRRATGVGIPDSSSVEV